VKKSVIILICLLGLFLPRMTAQNVTLNSNDAPQQVTGRVICGASGETLPFVTVRIKGTTTGTVTSLDGDFTLTVPSAETMLQISFVGYETVKIRASEVGDVVRMDLQATVLEAVVITGFQTISQERSAGAFNIVSGQTVADRAAQSGSIIGSLEGMATGLSINHGGGEDMFLIRGTNSAHANRQPLFVVDGVPMSAENVDLMVNEHDIQTFTILKDATAASIWGAQAANGVIVITTRQGRDTDRRLQVAYHGNINVRGRPDFDYLNLMSSEQFMRFANQIFSPSVFSFNEVMTTNFGLPITYFPLILPHEQPWYDYHNNLISSAERDRRLNALSRLNNRSQVEEFLTQPEFSTRHSLSVTGGGANYTVHGSFMYEHQQGLALTNRDRYAANIRQNFNIARWLSLDLTTNLVKINDNNAVLPGHTSTNNLLPYMMLQDANGNNLSHAALRYHESIMLDAQARSRTNLDYVPLDELNRGFNQGSSLNARINAGLTIRLMEGLNFEGRYQFMRNNGLHEQFWDAASYRSRFERVLFATQDSTDPPVFNLLELGGVYRAVNTVQNSWTVRNQLNFDRSSADRAHQITALLGTEVRADRQFAITNMIRNYDPQLMAYIRYNERDLAEGIPGTILVQPGGAGISRILESGMFSAHEVDTRFVSFYSNVAYTYHERYSFNASVRVDQSNLFGSDPSVQFRPIWATGVAWNVGHEDFMRNFPTVSRLNLRLSYGLGGNSPSPGMGGSFNLIQQNFNAALGALATSVISPANDQLVWERTRTLNFGVDVGVFAGRINASLDIYDRLTTDLLGWVPLDPTTGWNAAPGNLGSLRNRGFELTLNTRNITTRDFRWTTMLTTTFNRNKVLEVHSQHDVTALNRLNQRFLPGYAAQGVFAFRWAGLDEFGNPQVFDHAGNKVTLATEFSDARNLDASVFMGSSQPIWFGGLANSFSYKNFELSFLFVYNLGHVMRRTDTDFFTGRLNRNIEQGFENRWQFPGDERYTNVPGYIANPNISAQNRHIPFYTHADINVVSASYITLRDLSLSYALPKNITDKLSLQSVRVRLQAGNLFFWAANDDGIDPEAYHFRSATRLTRFGATFSAGLTVNFN